MPIFIAINLIISLLIQTSSPYLKLLTSPLFLNIGIACVAVSIFAALIKKISFKIWYDLFAVGALLIWFADWHILFQDDAPMFYFFPLYFCFLTAFVSIFFINQREYIDEDTLYYMKYLASMGRFHTGFLMFGILVSLQLKNHFLIYPIIMTLFIIKYTLTSCLETR